MAKRRARRSSRSPTGRGGRVDGAFFFDEATADSAARWIENRCSFYIGEFAGEPFLLQPWQRDDIIRPLFGWKRRDPTVPREDWPRLIRTLYLEVGKGNGKTPLGAAIALLLLLWDCEPAAEVYSAAADKDQASIVFNDGSGFVSQEPELSSRVKILPGARRIVYPETQSFWQVLSSDSRTKHGFRPHGIIFDELHTQRDRRLYAALQLGLKKRRQPLLVLMTTSGEYDEEALWWNEHEYALAVRDGELEDPTYLPIVYSADFEDDLADPAALKKANPNLGVSVKLEDLQEGWKAACGKGPAAIAEFRQYHGNIPGESTVSPISSEKWRRCDAEPVLEGPCFIGVDVSSKLDLTAAVAYFPESHSVLPHFWIPGEGIKERKRRDIFDYPVHVKAGLISLTEGNYIDQRAIHRHLVEWGERFEVLEIGYDRRFVTDLPHWLEDDGFKVIEVRQGYALSEALTFGLGLIEDEDLKHGGNPVLGWNARNVRIKRNDDGQLKVVKRAERKRVDGITAWLNAIDRAIAHRHDLGDDLLVGTAVI